MRPAQQSSGERRVPAIAPAAAAKPRANGDELIPNGVPLLAGFENKVGRYELVRVDGNQAYYSFTNLHGKTVDAIMSATMWRRMQAHT